MATRRYKTSAGQRDADVVEEVGAATNSNTVELTVDLASTQVNANGTTRQITREEVLEALERFENKILSGKWPPA